MMTALPTPAFLSAKVPEVTAALSTLTMSPAYALPSPLAAPPAAKVVALVFTVAVVVAS